ncbi:MAG: type II secretion system F family protein [Mycobacteriales bacterium]
MSVALLLGMLAGAGGWLLVYSLVPARPSLAVRLSRIDAAARAGRIRSAPTQSPAPRVAAARWAVGDRLAHEWNDRGWDGERLRANLALMSRPAADFFAAKLLWFAGGLLWIPLLAALLSVAGVSIPVLLPAWLSLLFAGVAFLVPDRQLQARADERRRDFRAVMGVYLDLVAMKMASGSGLAEALRESANIGHGWAFARVRAALEDARTDGISPAAALGRLGVELDVPDLRDLSASLVLVDSSGAQAEASLRAKAQSLRARELSDAHGQANEKSQVMLVAQVLFAVGFLLFLGVPAFYTVMAG